MNAILLAVFSVCIWKITVAIECNGTGGWKNDNGDQSLVLNGSTSDKCVAIYWFHNHGRKNFQASSDQCNQKFGGNLMDFNVWKRWHEEHQTQLKDSIVVFVAFNGSSGPCRVVELKTGKESPGACIDQREGYVCEFPIGSKYSETSSAVAEPSIETTPSMSVTLILGIVGAAMVLIAFFAAIGLIVYCKTRRTRKGRQSHHTKDCKKTGKDASESEGAMGEESRHPIRAKRSKPSKPKTKPSEDVEVDSSDTATTGRTKKGKKQKNVAPTHKAPKARFRRKLIDSPSGHVRPWPLATKKAQKKVDEPIYEHIYDTLGPQKTKSAIAKIERNAKPKH